jgi:tRNA(Ile)-lysidine synthase TilS/MesJ
MNKTGRFLTTVGEQHPVVLCEEHAKVFEIAMIANDIPHTIYEFDDETESQHCQACDLKIAKAYAKQVEEASTPKIVLPGNFN